MSILSRIRGTLAKVSSRLFSTFGASSPAGDPDTIIVKTHYGIETLTRLELTNRGYDANDVVSDATQLNRYTDILGKVYYDRAVRGYRDTLTGRKVSRQSLDSAYNQHRAEILASRLYNQDPKRSTAEIATIITEIEDLRSKQERLSLAGDITQDEDIEEQIRLLVSP